MSLHHTQVLDYFAENPLDGFFDHGDDVRVSDSHADSGTPDSANDSALSEAALSETMPDEDGATPGDDAAVGDEEVLAKDGEAPAEDDEAPAEDGEAFAEDGEAPVDGDATRDEIVRWKDAGCESTASLRARNARIDLEKPNPKHILTSKCGQAASARYDRRAPRVGSTHSRFGEGWGIRAKSVEGSRERTYLGVEERLNFLLRFPGGSFMCARTMSEFFELGGTSGDLDADLRVGCLSASDGESF